MINWKLRFKNKTVLMALVSAALLFASSVAQALGLELPVEASTVEEAAASVLALLAAVGVVVDPTTEGVADSEGAMQYEVPRPDTRGAGR